MSLTTLGFYNWPLNWQLTQPNMGTSQPPVGYSPTLLIGFGDPVGYGCLDLMCANVSSHLSSQYVHYYHLVDREMPHSRWPIICERYWLIDLALTFKQFMQPPPKISDSKLKQILVGLEYEIFICYLGRYGTSENIILCRLPPNDFSILIEY